MKEDTLDRFFSAIRKLNWEEEFPDCEEGQIVVYVIDDDYDYGYNDYYKQYSNPSTFAEDFIKDFDESYGSIENIRKIEIIDKYDDDIEIISSDEYEK